MNSGYAYLWEFVVATEHVREFERAYGPAGEWAQLFQQAPGYLETELHRDVANPRRYLTIDYWESVSAYDAFRARFAAEFAALDARCAEWTIEEKEIGRFTPVA